MQSSTFETGRRQKQECQYSQAAGHFLNLLLDLLTDLPGIHQSMPASSQPGVAVY